MFFACTTIIETVNSQHFHWPQQAAKTALFAKWLEAGKDWSLRLDRYLVWTFDQNSPPNNALILVFGFSVSFATPSSPRLQVESSKTHTDRTVDTRKRRILFSLSHGVWGFLVRGVLSLQSTLRRLILYDGGLVVWWGSCCHFEDGVLVPKSLHFMVETMMQLIAWSPRRDKREWSKVTLTTPTSKLSMPSP